MKLWPKNADETQIQEPLTQTEAVIARLTRCYGHHALAFFGLAPENAHFLTPAGEGLVNYRLVGKVAVVLGDPLCAFEARERVTRAFLDFCALRKWNAVFYQASAAYLQCYGALKLHTFKMGEEAVLDPQTFTLSGSARANIRTSCRRAEREGVAIEWYEGVPPVEIIGQLAGVSNAWLGYKVGEQAAERGFSMGRLDELVGAAQRADRIANRSTPIHPSQESKPRLLTEVARMPDGTVCAFVTFTPIYGVFQGQEVGANDQTIDQAGGWTVDLMRRAPDAAPGTMELLLVRAIEHMQVRGARRVNLGLAAWADTNQEMSSTQRQLTSFATEHLDLLASGKSLFNFKQKFQPCWQSCYIVGTTLITPAVILAVLRLRNGSDRKLIQLHVWRHTVWQFLRYCVVGSINTLIDVLILNLLLWCFPTGHVLTLLAYNSLAYTGGAGSSFFLNKYWTFRQKQSITWREMRRFVLVLILEIVYSNGLLWLAGEALQPIIHNVTLWGNASKLLAVAGGTILSYAFLRYWAFAQKP